MAFFLDKNLVFIESKQFANSILDKLVQNLSHERFKYLVEEFESGNLKLLKQKDDYAYGYIWLVLKGLMNKDCLLENIFTALQTIYVGFTVLDLSKWKMYDFYYNFIKNNFDAKLLFTNTDNFTYEIKSKNVYEEFFKRKDLFDFIQKIQSFLMR